VAAFALVGAGFLLFGENLAVLWDVITPITVLAGASGLVGGVVFSIALGTVHSRRRLSELSPLRMALWGAGAGLLVPMALLGVGLVAGVPLGANVILGMAAVIGGFGAATAGGTIKLAQMADRELDAPADREMLGSGE
jgi:hypothetical protein